MRDELKKQWQHKKETMVKEKNKREDKMRELESKSLDRSEYLRCFLILFIISKFYLGPIKAQSCDVSTLKISKETAQKYQQLLEDEKEYVVEKLLAVRECDNGALEFLTKWEGYSKDHSTWEKFETFNGPLHEWFMYF